MGKAFPQYNLDLLKEDIGQEYKHLFLLDVFCVLNLCGTASEEGFAAAAGIAQMLGCDSEDITVTAEVAKAVLTDDFSGLAELRPSRSWGGAFGEVIPEAWLLSQRAYCGMYVPPGGWDVDKLFKDLSPFVIPVDIRALGKNYAKSVLKQADEEQLREIYNS